MDVSYACDLIFSFCLAQTVCQDVGGDEADDDEQQVFKMISQFLWFSHSLLSAMTQLT